MGNTSKSDGSDHDYYRRPANGVEPQWEQQPAVQVVDDGAGPGGAARPSRAETGGAGSRGGAAAGLRERPGPAGGVPAPVAPWRRFNIALAAAWLLVGALLAVGLAWLTGVFSAPQMY